MWARGGGHLPRLGRTEKGFKKGAVGPENPEGRDSERYPGPGI